MAIFVDVAIYGKLAKLGGGKYIAQLDIQFESGARLRDLFDQLKIPPEETSYIFINAVLCDVPGLNASAEILLNDGDHIGIFSEGYMWPYQYRDGMPMSDSLKEALSEHGALHHTYKHKQT